MLDMGFEPDIRRIVAAIPHKEGVRQTVMFRCVVQLTYYDRPVPLFVFALLLLRPVHAGNIE
jgi:hypothetical protein